VSNHLNDRIAPGAMLRVRGPSGSFAAPTTDALVMIAGGSGITPLFAIAREVSKRAPDTRLTLIYGNRSPRDAIFAKALAEMADAGRLVFDPVFESAPPEHPGPHGVLDRAMIEARLDALRIDTASATFLICGPTPMRAACRAALEARDVAPEAIREEIFVRPERVDDGKPLPKDKVTVSIRVGADVRDVVVAPGRTLLEAGLSAGAALPYSCTMGGCAACRVRLVKGEVRMEEPNCLTDDERARGYVLACVSRPLGACEVEVEP
jgi:ferredoxin-NADP reductase